MIYSVNEGKQAEEYKDKKDYEKYLKERDNTRDIRYKYGDHNGNRSSYKAPYDDNHKKASNMTRHLVDDDKCTHIEYQRAHDAARRNIRRHPEHYKEGTIFESVVFMHEAYKIPIRNFVEKIKLIKNCKPGEYDGPEETKKFVDENYKDILKCAEILESEPKKLSDERRKHDTKFLVTFLIGFVTVPIFGIGMIPALAAMIMEFIYSANVNKRVIADNETINNLSKIKKSLKAKLNDKDIEWDTRRKISIMIDKIDDMEYEFQAVQKTQKL